VAKLLEKIEAFMKEYQDKDMVTATETLVYDYFSKLFEAGNTERVETIRNASIEKLTYYLDMFSSDVFENDPSTFLQNLQVDYTSQGGTVDADNVLDLIDKITSLPPAPKVFLVNPADIPVLQQYAIDLIAFNKSLNYTNNVVNGINLDELEKFQREQIQNIQILPIQSTPPYGFSIVIKIIIQTITRLRNLTNMTMFNEKYPTKVADYTLLFAKYNTFDFDKDIENVYTVLFQFFKNTINYSIIKIGMLNYTYTTYASLLKEQQNKNYELLQTLVELVNKNVPYTKENLQTLLQSIQFLEDTMQFPDSIISTTRIAEMYV
jgi:hypothetical protein